MSRLSFGALQIAVLSAACMAASSGLRAAELKDSFIDKPFKWKHESGVGGRSIHKADGVLIYDTNGERRTTRWTMSGKTLCVNAGAADEWCFTLVKTGDSFRSEDGSIVYTPE